MARAFSKKNAVRLLCALLAATLLLASLLRRTPQLDLHGPHAWLRASRNGSLYVRPLERTALVEPAPCDAAHRLVLLVTSAPGHQDARRAVRETWGAERAGTKRVFCVGRDTSRELQERVLAEAARYQDILVEDFTDSYHNLTLKTLFMLKWAVRSCAGVSFALKTDDDVLVNTRALQGSLSWAASDVPFLTGMRLNGPAPYRNPADRWYLPRWLYAEERLPPFITGTAYVMSGSALPSLLAAALNTPLINLEDVFLTGLVASRRLGMPLIHDDRFKNSRPRLILPCLFRPLLVAHELTPNQIRHLWDKLHRLRPGQCDQPVARLLESVFGIGPRQAGKEALW